jgi:hypothetical protein
MPSDSDVGDKALVARRAESLDRSAWPVSYFELFWFDQIVQLDEVESIDPQTLQRKFKRSPGFGTGTVAGFARQKHFIAMVGQPRSERQL